MQIDFVSHDDMLLIAFAAELHNALNRELDYLFAQLLTDCRRFRLMQDRPDVFDFVIECSRKHCWSA